MAIIIRLEHACLHFLEHRRVVVRRRRVDVQQIGGCREYKYRHQRHQGEQQLNPPTAREGKRAQHTSGGHTTYESSAILEVEEIHTNPAPKAGEHYYSERQRNHR